MNNLAFYVADVVNHLIMLGIDKDSIHSDSQTLEIKPKDSAETLVIPVARGYQNGMNPEVLAKHTIEICRQTKTMTKEKLMENLFVRLIPDVQDNSCHRITKKLPGKIEQELCCLLAETTDGIHTIRMTQSVLDNYGINEDEAWQRSMENTVRKKPAVLMDIFNMPAHILSMSQMRQYSIDNLEPEKLKDSLGYAVTTQNMINGAVTILYPNVLKKISEIWNEDLHIVFLSKHEAIVHPISMVDLDALRAFGADTIKAATSDYDFLTNSVLRYNKETDEITATEDN